MRQMDSIRREAPLAAQRPLARSSLTCDWVTVALCAWLQGGGFLDGWAHNHYLILPPQAPQAKRDL
jgi:hypothetical protein